jgi:hypothetical protein
LVNNQISQPKIEFVVQTVLFGNLRRPACRRTFTVHAETADAAKRVLKHFYPRSSDHCVVSSRRLAPVLALID